MSKIYDALRKSAGEPVTPVERRPPGVPSDDAPPPTVYPVSDEPLRDTAEGEEATFGDVVSRELAHLRASVEQALPDVTQRTILVAGSVPGEGASTVAAQFARFLGGASRLRVALVDADLRNADPRPVETVGRGEGLASVLSGRLAPADAFRPSGLRGLDVVPSEGVDADPYELCTAEHLAPFLNYLRGQYHYAILDVAPVLAAPETAVLAGEVDGVVLVVRAGKTKREVIKRSLDRLNSYHARVLGVVMNRQQYVIPEFIYRRL